MAKKKRKKTKRSKKHPLLLQAQQDPQGHLNQTNTVYITDCFGWFYKEGHRQCKKCPDAAECEYQKRMNKLAIKKAKEAEAKRRSLHPSEIDIRTNVQVSKRKASKEQNLRIIKELDYEYLKVGERYLIILTAGHYIEHSRDLRVHLGISYPTINTSPISYWRRCNFGYFKIKQYRPDPHNDSVTTRTIIYSLRPRLKFEEQVKTDKEDYKERVQRAKTRKLRGKATDPDAKREKRRQRRLERKRQREMEQGKAGDEE